MNEWSYGHLIWWSGNIPTPADALLKGQSLQQGGILSLVLSKADKSGTGAHIVRPQSEGLLRSKGDAPAGPDIIRPPIASMPPIPAQLSFAAHPEFPSSPEAPPDMPASPFPPPQTPAA